MLRLPYEELVQKIVAQSDVSQSEVEGRVKKKMDQLSGLISKEGAAHIIANELGVSLFEEYSGKVVLNKVLPGLRNIEVVGKILQLYGLREFQVSGRSGKVANILLGDESGKIRLVLWGDATKTFDQFKEGDVLAVQGAYSRDNNGYVEVHANDRSTVKLNPEGVAIKVNASQLRKSIEDLKDGDMNVEVLATLVEISDPRFFEVCSECRKRIKPNEEGVLVCKDHEGAPISYSYVLNAFLDDGSENIRAVFFSDQMEKLLEKNKDELLSLKENSEGFSQVKETLLGKPLKVRGRVTKNKMFEREEFIVNSIDHSPDPKEELARLE